MGTRVALAAAFVGVAVLVLWLGLRGEDTDTEATLERDSEGVHAVELRGIGDLKPRVPRGLDERVADNRKPDADPPLPNLIDDSVPGVRVSGRVLLAGTEEPIKGAAVAAWTVAHRERTCEIATTDESGAFTLPRVAAHQPVWLVAHAAGWHAVGTSITVNADVEDHVIHVGAGGTLEGHVTHPDGRPAAGLELWLVRPGLSLPDMGPGGPYFDELRHFYVPRVKTDAAGAYVIRGVPLDTERLPAVKLSAIAEVTGEPVRFARDGEVLAGDIRLPKLASLTVTVFGTDGQIVADEFIRFENARVHFMSWESGLRLADGSFRVDGITPGTWTVCAHIPGAGSPEQEILLQPGAEEAVEFRPALGGVVEGVVVDTDGRPVEGASVAFWGPEYRSDATDQEGRFRFIGLPAQHGTLRVEAANQRILGLTQLLEGRVPVPRTQPLAPVKIDDVRPGGDPLRIVLPYGGRLRGTFVGLEPGAELRSLLLTPERSGGATWTLPKDRAFTRYAPQPGMPFLLKFTAPDGRYWMRQFDALKPAEDIDLGEIVLEEGANLNGSVVAARGGPIKSARVRLTQRWAEQEAWTDASGQFHFKQVPQRPVYVRVDAKGYPPAFRVLDARARTGQQISLSEGGMLELRVLDVEGALLTEGSFTVWWNLESKYGADLDGLFDAYRIHPSGTTRLRRDAAAYRVGVWDKTGQQRAWIHPEVREGETTAVEVRLERKP